MSIENNKKAERPDKKKESSAEDKEFRGYKVYLEEEIEKALEQKVDKTANRGEERQIEKKNGTESSNGFDPLSVSWP